LIVAINGSPRTGSRTGVLLNDIMDAISARVYVKTETIDLGADSHEIFSGVSRDKLSEHGEALVSLTERADLIVVGSPIYRGTYTGLFKHFFDLIDRDRMAGKAAVLSATGASLQHALSIEHQFRPLMGFFNIMTAATAPFATDSDFNSTRRISSEAILNQIKRVAIEAEILLAVRRSLISFPRATS
jgi:FMN reductase